MLRLRNPRFERAVKPPIFVVPFGPLIPVVSIAIALAILAGASRVQLMSGACALAAGAVLYLVAVRGRRRVRAIPGAEGEIE